VDWLWLGLPPSSPWAWSVAGFTAAAHGLCPSAAATSDLEEAREDSVCQARPRALQHQAGFSLGGAAGDTWQVIGLAGWPGPAGRVGLKAWPGNAGGGRDRRLVRAFERGPQFEAKHRGKPVGLTLSESRGWQPPQAEL